MGSNREDERKDILIIYSETDSLSYFLIAQQANCSRWTIKRIIEKMRGGFSGKDKPQSGRPEGPNNIKLEKKTNKVSQFLQNQSMEVLTAIHFYESLISFVGNMRQDFDKYEEDGKILTKCCDYGLDIKRRKKKKITTGDGQTLFLMKNADNFKYLDCNFENECIHFKYIITALVLQESAVEKPSKLITWLQTIPNKDLTCTFPNMDIILRIYLCIPVTNCSGKRSFSTPKQAKSYLPNLLTHDKTADLSMYRLNQM
ncbi:hypothetical protein ILUMI_00866 [Ignelater luminosus]|uniref:HAT C-terminal dimerisation domain-containing protein n=1 Tax=Ignelater luminosus TaxID=2038154 RepID=A0A8K0DKS7_IGNLU|nr:hypothetical protein ILUMI_00866 [Ignelater luminosus]